MQARIQVSGYKFYIAVSSCVIKGAMGFAVRVRSAGQKYGPACHQRDRADVTEFVTLVRLSSLGQHVGVLALAGYKRRKSALTANPYGSMRTCHAVGLFEVRCGRPLGYFFLALQHWRLYISCGSHDHVNGSSVSLALSGT